MKLFQNFVSQIREIIDYEFGITDDNGLIIASSDDKQVGQVVSAVEKLVQSKENSLIFEGASYQKVIIKGKLEYIAYIKYDGNESSRYLSLIVLNIIHIKEYYDEKFDKGSFVKNIILNNVLPGDIPIRAKEFHLDYNAYRVALLVKTENVKDLFAYDMIQELFPNRSKDFVVALDDDNTVLIKLLKSKDDEKEVEKAARIILDSLNAGNVTTALVGIGTIVDNLKDIGRSYKEAQIALLVGGIFENEKIIINYNKLGIGRLIYQLPTTLCRLFLKEVFREGSFESLDSEMILTIEKFFDNNLNVSETSRQLYIHRNTLVYRLDKIEKITGLDLRKFDDAIIFKVAMLVKKYLENGEMML
jgi:carbohydrate diacid regulator